MHQFVHTLSYGDAISSEVLALQQYFQVKGASSNIYAINEHPKLKGKTISYKEFPSDSADQVILHYSLGSPLNKLYSGLSSQKNIIYHNLTPSKWFENVNPRVAEDIKQGQKELPELLALSDQIIADSKFNAKELESLGYQAKVLELAVDPDRWNEAANPGMVAQLQADSSLHLVHVGRLAPNKCIEDIIKVFYCLKEKLDVEAKLWLVGIDIDTEVYSFSLKRLVNFLGLDPYVNFVGCFADSELRALYENASCYICMSEHEGFCLPVVEAMHFSLPVVAYASSALPDTIGNGGIIVEEKDHYAIAALVEKIYKDQALRKKLIEAGKQRVQDLSLANFQNNLDSIFAI